MLFPTNAGVIPWQQYEHQNPVLQHALRLLEQPDATLNKADVADQVTQRLLGFPTLSETTSEEEGVLISRLTDHYHDYKWGRSDLFEFLTKETYLVQRGGVKCFSVEGISLTTLLKTMVIGVNFNI